MLQGREQDLMRPFKVLILNLIRNRGKQHGLRYLEVLGNSPFQAGNPFRIWSLKERHIRTTLKSDLESDRILQSLSP